MPPISCYFCFLDYFLFGLLATLGGIMHRNLHFSRAFILQWCCHNDTRDLRCCSWPRLEREVTLSRKSGEKQKSRMKRCPSAYPLLHRTAAIYHSQKQPPLPTTIQSSVFPGVTHDLIFWVFCLFILSVLWSYLPLTSIVFQRLIWEEGINSISSMSSRGIERVIPQICISYVLLMMMGDKKEVVYSRIPSSW